MFCCDAFRSTVQDAGTKGIAIIAHNEEGFRFFCLQARACDYDEEEKLKNTPSDPRLPRFLRIASQFAIKYCPFCGSRLEEMIKDNQLEFDTLAKSHERFLLH